MDVKSLAGGVVLGAVVTGAVMVLMDTNPEGSQGEHAATNEVAASDASFSGPDSEIAKLQKQLDEQRSLNAELEKTKKTLEAQISRQKIQSVETPELPVIADEIKNKIENPLLSFGDYQEILNEIDWDKAGTALENLLPLITELAAAFAEDKMPSPETFGMLQRWNGELVTVAMTANGKVPGSGVNGAFTHPSMASNSMASLLMKAGKPLTDAQANSLKTISDQYVIEDETRRASYGEDTMALQKILDEAEMKDRFFSDSRKLLNPDQDILMYNDATRGRVSLDVFSSGVVWSQYSRPVMVKTQEEFTSRVHGELGETLKLDDTKKAQLKSVVERWANGFPKNIFSQKPDVLETKGMMRTARVMGSARRQVALMKELRAELGLSDEQWRTLRNNQKVFVPLYTPAEK